MFLQFAPDHYCEIISDHGPIIEKGYKSAIAGVKDSLYESSCAPRSSVLANPYTTDGLAKRKSVNV